MQEKERNELILRKMAEFTAMMTREPGARERCREYIKQLGAQCGFWYDDEDNIHYDDRDQPL